MKSCLLLVKDKGLHFFKTVFRTVCMTKFIIFSLFSYHILLMVGGVYCNYFYLSSLDKFEPVWINSSLFGMTGGCVYCMRGIYIHYCAKNNWDNRWCIWHIIRPFVSLICGGASVLFIKAGLLLLTVPFEIQNHYGIYALVIYGRFKC